MAKSKREGERPMALRSNHSMACSGRENLVVAVAPAEPREIIAHRVRQIAHGAVGLDTERAMPLGELGAIRPVDQRNMREGRNVPAHGVIELRLPRRVGEVVVAADNMGDAHVVIVDHDGEHVGRRAVRAQQHHVVEVLVGPGDMALHAVCDGGLALARRLEPHGITAYPWANPSTPCRARCRRSRRRAPSFIGALAHGGKLLWRRIAAIGLASLQHLVRDLRMPLGPRELIDRLAVPIEVKPLHPVDDRGDRGFGRAGAVGILDAQQEFAAGMLRVQPAEQRRARAAYVQEAGGGRVQSVSPRRWGTSSGKLSKVDICTAGVGLHRRPAPHPVPLPRKLALASLPLWNVRIRKRMRTGEGTFIQGSLLP